MRHDWELTERWSQGKEVGAVWGGGGPPEQLTPETLKEMGNDRNKRRGPRSPWGPLVVIVIIVGIALYVLLHR